MYHRMPVLTLVFGIVAVASAETLDVPSQYPTIRAAMFAAQNGDTVLVADGTYTGPDNRNLWFNGKAMTVRSENGPANCIIDCESAGVGFAFSGEPPESVVDGFTITNGMGIEGGGIYCYYNSNPTIRNCIITGNMASGGEGGGGIYLALANPTITNCMITGNTASDFTDGGGIYCLMSNPVITNCTIAGNTTDGFGGGIYSAAGSNPMIINSILWGNGPEEIHVDAFSAITVRYSDVQGDWPGAGNIDADPLFVDPSNGNYHCEPGSPAIDSADNIMVPAGIISDLDGNPRFQDDPGMPNTGNPDGVNPIVDMGAYEFQGAGGLIPTVSEWGVCTMTLLMLTAGTIVLGRRCPACGQ